MDTRSKILSPEAACEVALEARRKGRRLKVLTGYFDVVVATHAHELRQVRNGTEPSILMVVLTPPPQPVLSERARAELIAAFGVVDYVVNAGQESIAGLLENLHADEIIHRESEDDRCMQQLIEHVHRRHHI
jgi:glycerol-3-phosphate cytidylyltransferase-like family protein